MFRLKKPQIIARLAIIGVMAALLMLGSCRATKPVMTAFKDSTSTFLKVVERDTAITAPAAKASLTVAVADVWTASNDQATKDPTTSKLIGIAKSKQARVTASVKDGRLQVDCNCDTVAIIAKLKDKYQSQSRTVTKTVTLPPVQIKYIPWYVSMLAWVGGLGILVLVLTLLARKFSPKKL
jgi:Trk-type K+ transport system membrane component